MGRTLDTYADILNRLEVAENSILQEIKFKDSNNNIIRYALKKMYKINGLYTNFVIIYNKEADKEYLIDINSFRKILDMGYVNNATMSKTGYIKYFDKIAKFYNSCEVEIESLNSVKVIIAEIKALISKFGYMIKIDDKLDYMAIHRLEKVGAIFSLGKSIAGVELKNDFEHKLVSIEEFNKLSSQEHSQNNFSPRSKAQNFTHTLLYEEISTDEYNKLKIILGDANLDSFVEHECGRYYRARVDKLTLEMAKELYGIDNVYFAIPNPDKFERKSIFESAIRCTNHLTETEYSDDKYFLISCIGVDRPRIIKLLLDNFKFFKSDEYKTKYSDVIDWLDQTIYREDNKAFDEGKAELLQLIKDGNTAEEIMCKIGNKYRTFGDLSVADYAEMLKLESTYLNNNPDIDMETNGRGMSLEEICEIYDIDFHSIKVVSDSVDNKVEVEVELSTDTQPEETQPEETQPEETQPEETQPEETQPEETQPEETQRIAESCEDNKEDDFDNFIPIVKLELGDMYESNIEIFQNKNGYLGLKLTQNSTTDVLVIPQSNIKYIEWCKMQADLSEFKQVISRFLLGKDTTYTVEDIIKILS